MRPEGFESFVDGAGRDRAELVLWPRDVGVERVGLDVAGAVGELPGGAERGGVLGGFVGCEVVGFVIRVVGGLSGWLEVRRWGGEWGWGGYGVVVGGLVFLLFPLLRFCLCGLLWDVLAL